MLRLMSRLWASAKSLPHFTRSLVRRGLSSFLPRLIRRLVGLSLILIAKRVVFAIISWTSQPQGY